jgi:cellulose synthase/poly-beta-1,6-N-acetylglucosamine synthase-like glycosyltransferase
VPSQVLFVLLSDLLGTTTLEYMKSRLRIIVPCYNEAERFRSDDFLSYLQQRNYISFLFVDDGSEDGTG